MKILTLNTHSLAEENATEKMELFAGILEKEQPEVMNVGSGGIMVDFI